MSAAAPLAVGAIAAAAAAQPLEPVVLKHVARWWQDPAILAAVAWASCHEASAKERHSTTTRRLAATFGIEVNDEGKPQDVLKNYMVGGGRRGGGRSLASAQSLACHWRQRSQRSHSHYAHHSLSAWLALV